MVGAPLQALPVSRGQGPVLSQLQPLVEPQPSQM